MEILNKINDQGDNLAIEVKYNKGGVNYFTYKTEERGLYLHLSPVNIKSSGGGMQVRTSRLMGGLQTSGAKQFLKPLGRKSKKQETFVENVVLDFNNRLFEAWKNNDRATLVSLVDEIIDIVN